MIQETKMRKDMSEKIIFSSSMKGEASNSEGASGGLLILYNAKQFKVNILYNDGNIILGRAHHYLTQERWFLLNIYAPNNKKE